MGKFKVGDWVYTSDLYYGQIVEIEGDIAYVEYDTGTGGGCMPFKSGELELAKKVRMVEYAEWYYDPNGMDWGLGAWLCSRCHAKNDNLGMGKDINPYMFSGSKFCPQCGAVMKSKESVK